MASQLANEVLCMKHCWGVKKQNSVVKNGREDNWTAELAIIDSNG